MWEAAEIATMAKFTLRRRERMLLIGGLILAGVVLLSTTVYDWHVKYRRSAAQLQAARDRLAEVQEWSEQIRVARHSDETVMNRVRARGPQFDLYSFIEQTLQEAKVRDRATLGVRQGMVSAQNLTAVDVSLAGVSMEELLGLFFKIYQADKLVVLHSMDFLKRSQNGLGLDCKFVLLSPKA